MEPTQDTPAPQAPVVDEPTTDTPVAPAPEEPTAPAVPDTPTEQPEAPAPEPAEPTESQPAEVEDEYPEYQLPQSQPLDFSQFPVDENNLIDPNALAGAINQQIAIAEERATMRAQQSFQENMAEQKAWTRAEEKYPELKTNKELKDLIHNARLGRVAELLSKTQDARQVKLPTPLQIAENIFKQIGTAKTEGMKQATENVKVQSSAYVETAATRTDDKADAQSRLFQQINNPDKVVAKQARIDLLKQRLFGE